MQAVFVSLKTASKKCLSFCFLSKHYMTFHFKSKVEIPQALHYFFMVHILRFLLRIYCFCVHSKGFLHRHEYTSWHVFHTPQQQSLSTYLEASPLSPQNHLAGFFLQQQVFKLIIIAFYFGHQISRKKNNLCSAQDVRSY